MSKTYKKHLENPSFRPLVYICAPYNGDRELNIKKAICYAEFAYKNGAIPLTPHLLFPFMDDGDTNQRKDIPVNDQELKELKKEMNRMGVNFSIMKNKEENNYSVFFQAKDTKVMEKAFKNAISKAEQKVEKKESVRESINKMKEQVKDTITKDKVKNKHQEQSL